MRNICRILGMVAVLLLVKPAMGALISDSAHHFSFELPSDWPEMPASEISEINGKSGQTFVLGARRVTRGTDYMLVMTVPRGAGEHANSPAQLRSLRQSLESGGMEVISADYDSRLDAIVGHIRMASEVGRLEGYIYIFFGRDEAVALYCYARMQDFSKAKPTYEALGSSFHFDPGYADGPVKASKAKVGLIIGIVVGVLTLLLLVAAGVGLLVFLLRRNGPAPVDATIPPR